MIRVCPERDAICPHGMGCPYAAGPDSQYRCKDGWRSIPSKPAETIPPMTHDHSGADIKALEAFARAYDKEDAAQMGEPDPWAETYEDPADEATWRAERIACAEVAARPLLDALASAIAARDEARAELATWQEVKHSTPWKARAEAAEARLEELTRERDEAKAGSERMEAERDAAQFAARNGRSLAEDSIHAIRELLNAHNVPLSAFIDDHVGNAIVQRNAADARLEEAKAALDRGARLALAAENFCLRFTLNDLPEMDDQQRNAVLDQIKLFREGAHAFLHQGGSDAH